MSGRARLAALRKRVEREKEKTKEIHVEVTKKRKEKAEKRVAKTGPAPVVKPVNSINVENWFRNEIWKLYGRKFIIPNWTVKQRTLAKKLLSIYGAELVEKAVIHMCSNWKQWVRRSKGGLSGAPTVNLLWGMRERVFADVQDIDNNPVESRPENSDEYNEAEETRDIGW